MRIYYALLVFVLIAAWPGICLSNNISASNVKIVVQDPVNDTYDIQFDISWDNSLPEVCKILGIFKNTLYNWERKGKIPKAHRDPMSRWRLYTQKDIERIKKISGRK